MALPAFFSPALASAHLAAVMSKTADELTSSTPACPQPVMLVGAGPLTSAISKSGSEQSGWRYRFTLVRQPADSDGDSNVFQPADLVPFVKLIQVLAAEISADGCLPQTERTALRNLAAQLDDFLGGVPVEEKDDVVSTL